MIIKVLTLMIPSCYPAETKEKNEAFGSSLLLSNSPLSPKVVNGSFAAIFDADEFLAKTYAGVRIAVSQCRLVKHPELGLTIFQHQESPSMRRRVRGILMSGKQFSLDSHMDVVVQTTLDAGSGATRTSSTNSYGRTTSTAVQGSTEKQASIQEDNEESPEGMKPR